MKRLSGILCSVALAMLASGLPGVPIRAQNRPAPPSAPEPNPAAEPAADPLADGFHNPPQPARPQVWWHWMSGNVTPEGARLDLEWMQRIGIGGVHAFAGGGLEGPVVPNPLPFMSDGWRAAYRASVDQARAAGMDVTIAGSPGWSETGGPWVKPADGMKKYTWAITEIEGGRPVHLILPSPATATGPFQAVGRDKGFGGGATTAPEAHGTGPVIAFPTPAGDQPLGGRYSSPDGDVSALTDAPEDLSKTVKLPIARGAATDIEIDLGTSRTISALSVAISPLPAIEILASDNGQQFRSIRSVDQTDAEKPAAQQTIALPPTRARFFRIRLARPGIWRVLRDLPVGFSLGTATSFTLRQLRLIAAPRIDRFEAKAGFQSIVDDGSTNSVPTAGIDLAKVTDLSSRVRSNGTLDWTPPPGRWTVLRFGWSLTGQTNGPAEPEATGLEVDKLDPVAVRSYVDHLFSLYRDQGGNALGPAGINGLLTDSWEAGVQNWTPAILADFRRLRGYDPTPWLPVLAGRVVGDTRRSEAFLYDFRQTLKDLAVSAHYEVLAEAAHRNGMTYYTEVQGDTPRAISDGLTAKARSDIPTGEFWYRPFATVDGQPSLVADLREAASAAHLYGKKLAAAEAMTVAAGTDPWAFSPAMLKPVADEIFASGINRILVHESHLQPFVDRKPGLELGIFGQFFNRNDTWAEQARPWVDYLARTSWMLQQGNYVADVAYFYGEEQNLTQRFELKQNADVPPGYGFDYVNPEALLTRLSVRDGMIVTDTGMRYRILFVPADVTRFSLPVLEKLESLLRAGAVVVAPRPTGGLGMASPDAAVARITTRLWGGAGNSPRRVGLGRLYPAQPPGPVLKAENVQPDVQTPPEATIMSLHRRTAAAELYFLSNRDDRPVASPIRFRVTGRLPEWWSAEDGSIRLLSFETAGGETSVVVPLEAKGAGFVVFRKRTSLARLDVLAAKEVEVRPLTGAWEVTFEAGRGAPAVARFDRLTDWSQNADAGIRYFSGVATYRRHVSIDPAMLQSGRRITLDLGDVRELASVLVNGRPIATAWHAPYAVDITDGLKPGDNLIEIAVTNLWVNRLIGDRQPGTAPIAYAPQSPYRAESALRPSGLLGPVRLVVRERPAF